MSSSSNSGKGSHWSCDPTEQGPPLKIGQSGVGALPPMTVMAFMDDAIVAAGNKVALYEKADPKAEWTPLTYKAYGALIRRAAKAFIHLGVQPHEGVGIIGFNSTEWFVADLGAIYAGAVATGVYSTNGPDACFYIVDHCKARVVLCEDDKQLEKFIQIRSRLPNLVALVLYKGDVPKNADGQPKYENVLNWNQFLAAGDAVDDSVLAARINAQKAEDLCTLIYTSGTTGPPKAVMLTHDNLTWTARSILSMVNLGDNESLISYLPLSHIAAQLIDMYLLAAVRGTVYFAQKDALRGSLATTLKDVRPTVFFGVPRVWEKIEEKMRSVGANGSWLVKKIGAWAKGVGLDASMRLQRGDTSKPWFFGLAQRLVFNKVRHALGLDRCTLQLTAAAPIRRETLDYFLSLYLPIFEVYGMSESTGPQTVNIPGAHRVGSTGRSFPDAVMKIDNPDHEGNGEICLWGRHVFRGYMHDEAATGSTIDGEGYLHSGDIGRVDKDGYLYITGRIKELIITAGGENIPPVLIEEEIKKDCPMISNVQVIGDKRKFLSCMITLKTHLDSNGLPTHELTHSVASLPGVTAKTTDEAVNDAALKKLIEDGIRKANARATSNAQKVQKFIIIPQDFTIEGGELTPTMKLRRRIVENKYTAAIDGMYADGGAD